MRNVRNYNLDTIKNYRSWFVQLFPKTKLNYTNEIFLWYILYMYIKRVSIEKKKHLICFKMQFLSNGWFSLKMVSYQTKRTGYYSNKFFTKRLRFSIKKNRRNLARRYLKTPSKTKKRFWFGDNQNDFKNRTKLLKSSKKIIRFKTKQLHLAEHLKNKSNLVFLTKKISNKLCIKSVFIANFFKLKMFKKKKITTLFNKRNKSNKKLTTWRSFKKLFINFKIKLKKKKLKKHKKIRGRRWFFFKKFFKKRKNKDQFFQKLKLKKLKLKKLK